VAGSAGTDVVGQKALVVGLGELMFISGSKLRHVLVRLIGK